MRTLKISLLILGITSLVQVAIVVASGSVSLLADTVHNFADALTVVPLAAAFWLSRRPPDHRYTYGYGRSEDLAGIVILLVIAFSMVATAWVAIERLMHPQGMHHVGWVIAAGLVGCVGNEVVAIYRTRTGRRIGSAALEADGRHARTDSMTSLAVVVGAIGVAIGWPVTDPIVGLVITVAVALLLKSAGRDVFRRLMDSVDPSLIEEVRCMLANVTGIEEVDAVRLRWVGHELSGEAEVVSDGSLSLAEAHDVAERATHLLLHQLRHLTRITIHTSPHRRADSDPHALTAHHRTPGDVGCLRGRRTIISGTDPTPPAARRKPDARGPTIVTQEARS